MNGHLSDAEIFATARKAIDDDPRIPQDVRIHVDRGTVTLTGSVRWPQEASDAEAVIRAVAGVRAVVNHLLVAQVVNPEGFEAPESR